MTISTPETNEPPKDAAASGSVNGLLDALAEIRESVEEAELVSMEEKAYSPASRLRAIRGQINALIRQVKSASNDQGEAQPPINQL